MKSDKVTKVVGQVSRRRWLTPEIVVMKAGLAANGVDGRSDDVANFS